MVEHGGMGRPKWHGCWRLGTLALHHQFAVFAAMLGADFEGEKIPLLGKRTKYFLHRFPVADDLIAVLQRLKWLRHLIQVIELDRPRLMPRFKKRRVHEVAYRNAVDRIFFVFY